MSKTELISHKKQKLEDGAGAAFHRIYTISLPVPIARARELMHQLQRDPNPFSPQALARFEKLCGPPEKMQKGDEFQIHITGPWNGPVRVIDVDETRFRFATLEGHLEAGEIEFRVKGNGSSNSVFQIESLARSKDRLVDFVFDKLPIARVAQTEMWTSFCKAFAQEATPAGEVGNVEVVTERRADGEEAWESC